MRKIFLHIIVFLILLPMTNISAEDTDIYLQNVKPNAMILVDTSGSMGWGVYEHTVDYGAFYDWASDLGDCDMIAGGCGSSNYFYNNHYDKNEILLVKGNIGVTIYNGITFTGDPGNPDYLWYTSNVIETGTYIDDNGNLTDSSGRSITDPNYDGRITVDSDGYILLDGERLPLDRNIKLHDYEEYPDGTIIDKGFAGMLNAPGWYFSGFEGIGSGASSHNVAENGDQDIYFFIPGNWINMQEMYNLYTAYTTNESYRTWKTRTYSESSATYTPVTVDIHSPNYPSNYPNNRDETYTITQIDASKIKLHFSAFYLEYNWSCRWDYVKIYKDSISGGNLLDTFCGNQGSFTTSSYTLGSTKKLIIVFHSDYSVTKSGFKIDRYEYLPEDVETSGYKMQTRLEVVVDAMDDVVDATSGKINWALASFSVSPTGNGAKIWQEFDTSLTDEELENNIKNYLDSFSADGGTPLGEALQDVWNHYHSKTSILPSCARNHTIVLSDGYPSADSDWSRISGINFSDWDSDGWTEDPYQYSSPPDDYFDDVAHWMYTHSISDKSEVSDPENSHVNVTSHMLSFTMSSPLMEDAAEDGGGVFVSAFNKQQLVNAFYSLGIIIANSVSYTAPVVSVDTTNKTQSGQYIYMTFFKPKSPNWLGNLKKYKVNYQIKSGCTGRDNEEWVVVDKNDLDATDCDGTFKTTSVSYWTDEEDGGEVEAGGAGKVLVDKLTSSSLSDPYNTTYRKIYFIDSSNIFKRFIPANLSSGVLNEADTSEKYKIINYVYGYTFDEDGSADHYPVAKRSWILGSMVHSEPVLLNYEADNTTLIVAAANDGQIHIFNDSNGEEIFSLIFNCFLNKLKNMNPDSSESRPLYFDDGTMSYYFTFDSDGRIEPKILIVGLRRGGRSYFAFNIEDPNPENWSLKWEITGGGSGDFSELGYSWSDVVISKMKIGSTDKTVGIFSGGYDPVEDDNSSPQTSVTMGRGIFIIDLDTGAKLYSYTHSDNSNMQYCIPATPTVITDVNGYLSKIYVTDIGGQLWKLYYDSSSDSLKGHIIFKSNPGSDSTSGNIGGTLDSSDSNRKFFYSPTVTVLGKCSTNYAQGSIGFLTKALYFGSGNRENPTETSANNRIYMVIDDIDDNDTTTTYTEQNLLNVTNDELDVDSGSSSSEKETILNKLHSAKGWFIKLGDINDSEEHSGEKILSTPILFNERAYFTSFTPTSTDPCNPHGISRVYSLKYCYGLAGINYNTSNDSGDTEKFDKTDRYRQLGVSLPSGVKIAIREGHVWALVSTGGGIPGVGKLGSPNIPQESLNIHIERWENFQNW